ncbi:hypothetical protein M3Y98_00747500 [Aphelenchoides besseyi]|nr:hypothetical protein M3Y98_00747500 [Aphelenchoides besseyi]
MDPLPCKCDCCSANSHEIENLKNRLEILELKLKTKDVVLPSTPKVEAEPLKQSTPLFQPDEPTAQMKSLSLEDETKENSGLQGLNVTLAPKTSMTPDEKLAKLEFLKRQVAFQPQMNPFANNTPMNVSNEVLNQRIWSMQQTNQSANLLTVQKPQTRDYSELSSDTSTSTASPPPNKNFRPSALNWHLPTRSKTEPRNPRDHPRSYSYISTPLSWGTRPSKSVDQMVYKILRHPDHYIEELRVVLDEPKFFHLFVNRSFSK